jgi:hypothetical protein
MMWVIKEMTKDGHWIQCATVRPWYETNEEAHRQRDEFAKRYPKRVFAVTSSDRGTE